MAKKSGDGGNALSVGTEAWNVADGYTKIKILRNLILLDRWETLAEFGAEEMDEDLHLSENQLKKRRMEALNRFVSTLQQLIGNVKFAIKSAKRKEVAECEDKIALVRKYIGEIPTNSTNAITHEDDLKINESLFKKIFLMLQEVKNDINIPINSSGLIFRESSEIDLEKIMKEIEEGG